MATDVLLLAQAVRGVASSDVRMTFEELVRGHEDEVYGLALRILGDRDAALEAAKHGVPEGVPRVRPIRPLASRSVTTSGGLISTSGRTETTGYAAAKDRVTVTVQAGASSVTVR